MKPHLRPLLVLGLAALGVAAALFGPASAQPPREPAAMTFRFGEWSYEYTITAMGSKSQGEWGRLHYAGKALDARSMMDLQRNDYLHTPWGTLYWWEMRDVPWNGHGWLPHPSPYPMKKGKRLASPDAKPGTVLLATADNGTTVTLAPGARLIVQLTTLDSKDRSWIAAKDTSEILQPVAAPLQLPLHMPGWETLNQQTFHFRAEKTGKTMLALRYGGHSDREWKVTVEVNE